MDRRNFLALAVATPILPNLPVSKIDDFTQELLKEARIIRYLIDIEDDELKYDRNLVVITSLNGYNYGNACGYRHHEEDEQTFFDDICNMYRKKKDNIVRTAYFRFDDDINVMQQTNTKFSRTPSHKEMLLFTTMLICPLCLEDIQYKGVANPV